MKTVVRKTVSERNRALQRNPQQRYIDDCLFQATRAINRLQRAGFSVEHLELGAGGRPRIHIGWHPRCSELGEPAVCTREDGVHYRLCMIQYLDCQVSWTER